jgi:hypothetical protein
MGKALTLALSLCVVIAPLLGAAAEAGNEELASVEEMAGSAKTPAEHRAVAAYFTRKASSARRDANVHHQMELSYSHWTTSQEMVKHCRELVSLDKQMAREYEALARAHTAKADTQK